MAHHDLIFDINDYKFILILFLHEFIKRFFKKLNIIKVKRAFDKISYILPAVTVIVFRFIILYFGFKFQ